MYHSFLIHSSANGHLGCFHILAIVNSAAVNTACAFLTYGFLRVCVLVVKNPPVSAGDIRDVGSIPGSGSSPGGGHGNPLQYSCLENPHRQKSLAGYSPWGREEWDMTVAT